MNKYLCITMTFWEYVRIGIKDAFAEKEPVVIERWTIKVIKFLIGILIGLLLGSFIIYIIQILNIVDIVGKIFLGFIVFATIIDSVALIIFLVISWRKAVKDCWDKFNKD